MTVIPSRVIHYQGEFAPGETKEFELDPPEKGQFVFVTAEGRLILAEVEVFVELRKSMLQNYLTSRRKNSPCLKATGS